MAQLYEFIVSSGQVFSGLTAGDGQPNATIYVLPGGEIIDTVVFTHLQLGYAIAGQSVPSNDGYGGTLITFEPSVTSTTGGHGHGNAIASPVTS
jgi:hypothetical protein